MGRSTRRGRSSVVPRVRPTPAREPNVRVAAPATTWSLLSQDQLTQPAERGVSGSRSAGSMHSRTSAPRARRHPLPMPSHRRSNSPHPPNFRPRHRPSPRRTRRQRLHEKVARIALRQHRQRRQLHARRPRPRERMPARLHRELPRRLDDDIATLQRDPVRPLLQHDRVLREHVDALVGRRHAHGLVRENLHRRRMRLDAHRPFARDCLEPARHAVQAHRIARRRGHGGTGAHMRIALRRQMNVLRRIRHRTLRRRHHDVLRRLHQHHGRRESLDGIAAVALRPGRLGRALTTHAARVLAVLRRIDRLEEISLRLVRAQAGRLRTGRRRVEFLRRFRRVLQLLHAFGDIHLRRRAEPARGTRHQHARAGPHDTPSLRRQFEAFTAIGAAHRALLVDQIALREARVGSRIAQLVTQLSGRIVHHPATAGLPIEGLRLQARQCS